jgi:Divergent InlB B-repeat domain
MARSRVLTRAWPVAAIVACLCLVASATAGAAPDPTLTVAPGGTGSGSVTSSPAGIDCGTTCSASFPSGTQVVLTAAVATGSRFAGWSGGSCSGDATTCTVTLTAGTTVHANFNQQETFAVAKGGSGAGTVTSSPGGISCGTTCSATFDQSTIVTLTENPSAGSRFGGWSGGGCSGTASTCAVTLSSSVAVTAAFIATPTLTIRPAGTGHGTVVSSPTGINCGGGCSASYDVNTTVILVAGAAAGSRFAGWNGGGCSGTRTCTVRLAQSTQVTARFNALVTITVAGAGTGAGSVTSSPAGIICGAVCTASYDLGTKVRLTAHPARGSRFLGWVGVGCMGTAACRLTLTQATLVAADFGHIVVAPNTRIGHLKKKRAKHGKRGRAKVWFTGSGGTGAVKFLCKIDKKHFKPCKSPHKYRHLRKGRHTIQVKAVDASGTIDPTPARITFKI